MIEAMRQEQRKRRLKIKTEGDAGPGGGMARPPTASPKNAAARRSPSNRRRGPAAAHGDNALVDRVTGEPGPMSHSPPRVPVPSLGHVEGLDKSHSPRPLTPEPPGGGAGGGGGGYGTGAGTAGNPFGGGQVANAW